MGRWVRYTYQSWTIKSLSRLRSPWAAPCTRRRREGEADSVTADATCSMKLGRGARESADATLARMKNHHDRCSHLSRRVFALSLPAKWCSQCVRLAVIWMADEELLFRSFAAAAALTAYSVGSNAKVFDIQHLPKNINQLQNGDSFSVECRNDHTRVIDRESVDVDAAVVTVEMAGSEPIVHHITLFSIGAREVQDRFGQRGMALFVRAADWGRIGTVGVGLIFGADDRWRSHHEDDTWWTCGN